MGEVNQTSVSGVELALERDHPDSEGRDAVADDIAAKESEETADDSSKEEVSVALEGNHTKATNDGSSGTKQLHPVGGSGSNGKEDSTDKNFECVENSKNRNYIFSPSWSELLKSPIGVLQFSPSESKSSHGLGLQLAVERNVSTAMFLGNVLSYLSSAATHYDLLGVNLLKMAQNVRTQRLPPGTPIDDDLKSLCDDIWSLGICFRSSAESYRASIIGPLKKSLSTNGTERDAVMKRYKEMRQESAEARKSARAKYSRAVNATTAAEAEIEAWFSKVKQKRQTFEELKETEETIDEFPTESSWEKVLKLVGKKAIEEEATMRLIQKLKFAETCKEEYLESIENENHCVKLSEEIEALALNKTQKWEEDQINFFVNEILSKLFPNDKNLKDVLASETTISVSEIDRTFAEGFEKKGIELLSSLKLFKMQTIPYEDGMGVMDAETLGLPEALGIQRDKIKTSFSARENRIEATEIIVKLFEEVADITSKSYSRMRYQIANERKRDPSERSLLSSIWQITLGVYELEAKLISEMVFTISKLEKWLSTSKRILEIEMESDDAAWKRLCDAARAEMKVESRYKQTIQQVQKARHRATSKEKISLSRRESSDSSEDIPQSERKRNDSSGSIGAVNRSMLGSQSTPTRGVRAFFKGGEAMKKLKENAMVQIAQMSLNEVDQKETKDQIALEEAVAEKKNALVAYASATKDRIDKIDAEDKSGWTEMKENVLKLAEAIEMLNNADFQSRVSCEIENSSEPLTMKMKEWVNNIQEKIHHSERASSSLQPSEYALTIKRITSENIDQLLEITEIDLIIPMFESEMESNEGSQSQSIENKAITLPNESNAQGNASSVKFEESQTPRDESAGNNVSCSEVEKRRDAENIGNAPVAVAGEELTLEVRAFVEQFWSEKPEDEKVPNIIDTFTCAYRPKERMGFLAPNLHGRLYITREAIYFLAAENNFTLHWGKILSITREKGFMGSNNANDLVVSYRSGTSISSFLLCRVKDRDKVVGDLQRIKAEYEQSEVSMITESDSKIQSQLPEVPPDSVLQGMEIVLSRTVKNVSVESIFEKVWADRVENESFYGSWLKDEECFDIAMEEWEVTKTSDGYRNEWCNEKYDQQRLVKFKFNRTAHLYIGPPVAIVKQRHFIRVEKNDKCVLAISAEFEGIPYADTFAVEMRWVATRVGSKDSLIQVGLFVNFKKNTMLKSQIKSGTITETKNVHLRLFDAVKKACTNSEDTEFCDDDKDREANEEIESTKVEKDFFATLGSFLYSSILPSVNSFFVSFNAHIPTIISYFSSLDVSTILSSIGIVFFLLTGIYFAPTVNSSCSDIQQLEHSFLELRQEVRALHASIDLIAVTLKEIEYSCVDAATFNSDACHRSNKQLEHSEYLFPSEGQPRKRKEQ